MVGTAKRACRTVHTTAKIVGRAVDNYSLPDEESLRTSTQLSMYEGDDDESKLWTGNDDELRFRTSVSEGSRRRRRREWAKRYLPVVIFVALIPTLIVLFLVGGFSPRRPDWKLREQAHDNVASENARNNSSWDERPVLQADSSKQADFSDMHGSAVKKGGEPQIRRRMAATRGDKSWKTSLPENKLWSGSKSSNKSGKSEGSKSKGSIKRGNKVRNSQDVVAVALSRRNNSPSNGCFKSAVSFREDDEQQEWEVGGVEVGGVEVGWLEVGGLEVGWLEVGGLEVGGLEVGRLKAW